MIYLDHNATSPLLPEAAEAMAPWLASRPANPSSVHRCGQRARAAVERSRQRVAELLGGAREQVIFTSGGTEANNLALWGSVGWPPSGHVVVSAVEHPSVLEPARALADLDSEVTILGVDRDGRVDPDRLRDALRPDTRLVSMMVANNETGTVQPVEELASVTDEAGVPLHCDAVQAAPWLDLASLTRSGVALMTLSAHKLGGPPGVGALWCRPGHELEVHLRGGAQQAGRRAGTEPTAAIVGFAAACRRRSRRRDDVAATVRELRDRLERGLVERIPDAHRLGGGPRLPNTVEIGFAGCDADALVARLDLDGLAVSSGAACSSGVPGPSHVLEAMGVSADLRRGAVRFSLGHDSEAPEIDAALEIVVEAVAAVRAARRPSHSTTRD